MHSPVPSSTQFQRDPDREDAVKGKLHWADDNSKQAKK